MKNKTLLFFRFSGKWKMTLGLLVLFFVLSVSYGQTPFPFSFINNSSYPDDQLYVAIVGEDLTGPPGQRVWIDLKTGQQRSMTTAYNTVQGPTYGGNMGPGGNGKYAACFTKLSEIPNKTFNLTGIQGSRIFISIHQQLYLYFFGPNAGYAAPDPGNPNDPNRGIHYEIIEMTYNNIGIWANTSRVDAYQVPMAVEVNGGSGFQMTGELLSHDEIVTAFLANVPAEFQGCYDPVSGEIKQPSKTAAFQTGGAYVNYMKPYIDAVWNKYKNEDLVVDLAGNGVWRGRVQGDDRLIMNCQSGGWNGRQGIVQRRPTTQEALEGKGVLAQPIADGGADLFFQAQLCAALTRHVVNSTTPNVGTQTWYDVSKYYQQSPCNHYAKFWHLPGISVNRLSYGFAYDDVNEQSSTIFASAPSKTLVVIGGYVPKVAITAPVSGTTYNAPASVTFQATASAATPNRSISKVEFYNGTTKIGEDNSSPYSFNWTNVAAGTYTITAKAIDNNGVVGTSAAITVKVNASTPPAVSITAPANNTSYTAPASIAITANAVQGSVPVSKVEFYNGATKLGEDNTSPYSFNWTNVPAGTYTITAKAIDNNNITGTSAPITVIVNPAVPPTVTITAPANNAVYTAPASVTINANAVQGSAPVSKVEFYNGATKLGEDNTSPYSFNWANVAAGTYIITAKAIDNNGIAGTSTAVTVVVNAGVAPTVSITSPANNTSYFAPAAIAIAADVVQGTAAIFKVEFYNGATKLGEDNTSPYSFDWTNVAAGTYSITAKAIDVNNLSSVSPVISVEVKSIQLPAVSIIVPASPITYIAPANITFQADVVEGSFPVTKVEFYNGAVKIGEDNMSPYSFAWTNVDVGNYSITAKAIDNTNLSTVSAPVTVIVKANQAPVVSISAPVNNTSYKSPASLQIEATATDADGTVQLVEFYNGTVLIGTDNSEPYSIALNNLMAGTYTLTAKAIDDRGLSSVSAAVSIVVKDNEVPLVSVTSPATGSNYTDPASFTIQADATDTDGTITKVEFYNGTTKLGEDLTAPYSFDWSNVTPGAYTVTAKAYDDNNAATVSTAIAIIVKAPNQAPSVSITSPANGFTSVAPASILIEATASDADGFISKVEFYNGSVKIGEDNTVPYSFNWTSIGVGSYVITARAYDDKSLSTTSASVTIEVKVNLLPQIQITSPQNNIEIDIPGAFTVTATAADADGTISKVEFYYGNVLINADESIPYSFSVSNVAAGTYTIIAKAYDDKGGFSTDEVTINVISPNETPQLYIVYPLSNTSVKSGEPLDIYVVASDQDGSIAKVEFYDGTFKLGEMTAAPYTFSWTNTSPGPHEIVVIATDDKGMTTEVKVLVTVEKVITSTNGSYMENSLAVYPNPTFGEIHFTRKIESIEVYTINGTKVHEEAISGEYVNISHLTSGTYVIRIIDGDSSQIVKITKQ